MVLGFVLRLINDLIIINEVNVFGFLNMLVVVCDVKVKWFIYVVSFFIYGDLEGLFKIEEVIGKLLFLYVIIKYVNELYVEIFNKIYGLEIIGLCYFNVFGRR